MQDSSVNKKYIAYALAAVIVVVGFAAFVNFRETSGGTLKVTLPLNAGGSFIIIDETQPTPDSLEDGVASYILKEGKHTIIHSSDGFWPWIGKFTIVNNETTKIAPFAVAENSSGFFLNDKDPEFQEIISLFKNSPPNGSDPKISSTGVKLWIEDGEVIVDRNGDREIIFNGAVLVSFVEFYKERDDVYIIAGGPQVFAIDGTIENEQNFMPINPGIRGVNTDFRIKGDGTALYVKSGDRFLIVNY